MAASSCALVKAPTANASNICEGNARAWKRANHGLIPPSAEREVEAKVFSSLVGEVTEFAASAKRWFPVAGHFFATLLHVRMGPTEADNA